MNTSTRLPGAIPVNPTIHGTLANALEKLNQAESVAEGVNIILFGVEAPCPSDKVPLKDRPVDSLARELVEKAQLLLELLAKIKDRI